MDLLNVNVAVEKRSMGQIYDAALKEYKAKGPLVIRSGGDGELSLLRRKLFNR